MPPPKKAAKKAAKKAIKKAAKKAAKKAPAKHAPHHEAEKQRGDLRRAFEHIGRVELLERIHPSAGGGVTHALAALAHNALRDGQPKQAADLLRAAEHWSFATLAAEHTEVVTIGPELIAAVDEQFAELLERAEEHWKEPDSSGTLASIYQSARKNAEKAQQDSNYLQALEYARAAEALSHVKMPGALKLESIESIARTDWRLAG